MRTSRKIALGTLFVGSMAGLKACGVMGGSDELGYTRAQLKQVPEKTAQAVSYMEQGGWCSIPDSALPRGWSHSDLVRQMACISNKESRFGAATTGPWTGVCGQAWGYLQVASCHKGKSITVQGVRYSCPATSDAQLRDDPVMSAKCSLYVYMHSIYGMGMPGLRPWEAKCSRSERFDTKANGEPVFPLGCQGDLAGPEQDTHCEESMEIEFLAENQAMKISVSNECPATKAGVKLLDISQGTDAGQVQESEALEGVFWADPEKEDHKSVIVNYGFLIDELDKPTLARVTLAKNDDIYHVTNPSPALPVQEKQAAEESDQERQDELEPLILPVQQDHR